MKIKGLQKLTLLDYPGKTACTVFLAGCNYRCPFCHNAGLVVEFDQEEISYETLFAFLEKRKNVLEGVCITGGEPTLNNDLPQLLAKIKEIGYSVKLDTNGTNPQMVKQLVEQGLVDYVAMDAKNGLESYPQTVGVKQLDVLPIMQTATYLMQNHVDYEFRTTVVDNFHTHESIESMGKWLKGAKEFGVAKGLGSIAKVATYAQLGITFVSSGVDEYGKTGSIGKGIIGGGIETLKSIGRLEGMTLFAPLGPAGIVTGLVLGSINIGV